MKSLRYFNRIELCSECGTQMFRVFHPPQVSVPKVEAHYSPAFGKVVSSRKEINEEIRKINGEKGMDLVEVGNDKSEKKSELPDRTDYRSAYQELRKMRGK